MAFGWQWSLGVLLDIGLASRNHGLGTWNIGLHKWSIGIMDNFVDISEDCPPSQSEMAYKLCTRPASGISHLRFNQVC
jgi:hypothetical protein